LEDVRREHVEQVEARHVGKFGSYQPGISPKPARQSHGRSAIDAEMDANLTRLRCLNEVAVAIARPINDHDFVDAD
jgi:hypothetical protein